MRIELLKQGGQFGIPLWADSDNTIRVATGPHYIDKEWWVENAVAVTYLEVEGPYNDLYMYRDARNYFRWKPGANGPDFMPNDIMEFLGVFGPDDVADWPEDDTDVRCNVIVV